MSRQSIILASLTVTGALALSGCAAGVESAPSVSPAAEVSTTDAMTCSGLNDVLTITANADAGLRDGRMAEQEQQGWYRLATRVLHGVPTRGEGDVSEVTSALKDMAPAIALGTITTTGIGSREWNIGRDELAAACTAANSETAVEKFTGG